MIVVTPQISLREDEIIETFVRASGPGGQHVNKASTAVQLRFSARFSRSLPNDVAIRLMKLAGSRLTLDGDIVILAQSHRSQSQNRDDALQRLIALIQEAAQVPVKRRLTKPTKGSMERRLATKTQRAGVKAGRRVKPED
jgi:ribosome-associated protein